MAITSTSSTNLNLVETVHLFDFVIKINKYSNPRPKVVVLHYEKNAKTHYINELVFFFFFFSFPFFWSESFYKRRRGRALAINVAFKRTSGFQKESQEFIHIKNKKKKGKKKEKKK